MPERENEAPFSVSRAPKRRADDGDDDEHEGGETEDEGPPEQPSGSAFGLDSDDDGDERVHEPDPLDAVL